MSGGPLGGGLCGDEQAGLVAQEGEAGGSVGVLLGEQEAGGQVGRWGESVGRVGVKVEGGFRWGVRRAVTVHMHVCVSVWASL